MPCTLPPRSSWGADVVLLMCPFHWGRPPPWGDGLPQPAWVHCQWTKGERAQMTSAGGSANRWGSLLDFLVGLLGCTGCGGALRECLVAARRFFLFGMFCRRRGFVFLKIGVAIDLKEMNHFRKQGGEEGPSSPPLLPTTVLLCLCIGDKISSFLKVMRL